MVTRAHACVPIVGHWKSTLHVVYATQRKSYAVIRCEVRPNGTKNPHSVSVCVSLYVCACTHTCLCVSVCFYYL